MSCQYCPTHFEWRNGRENDEEYVEVKVGYISSFSFNHVTKVAFKDWFCCSRIAVLMFRYLMIEDKLSVYISDLANNFIRELIIVICFITHLKLTTKTIKYNVEKNTVISHQAALKCSLLCSQYRTYATAYSSQGINLL